MGQDKFSQRLLKWFDRHGRHELPWQSRATPYRVWVSEIMLQQTQVATVIPYYTRFMQRFPDLHSLAVAELDEVLYHWSGLGYYARGRNLHKAASIIQQKRMGRFPETLEEMVALPGIGRSTAAAILALSMNQRHAILDGNVKRCLCRYHGVEGYPGIKQVEDRLWKLAESHTPEVRVAEYTQAIMDLGATLCTRSKPECTGCPMREDCFAFNNKQTASLPRPRPRKKRPVRRCHMLVMRGPEQQVALFKRPASGIWGGLYSLPEFSSRKACCEQLQRYQLNRPDSLNRGEKLVHKFTHFDLQITPQILSLSEAALQQVLSSSFISASPESTGVLEENTVYYPNPEVDQIAMGIPTPIRKIIDHLEAGKEVPPDKLQIKTHYD